MGPTGGKSFTPAFSRTHLQDGNENEDVGGEDYEKGVGEVKSCHPNIDAEIQVTLNVIDIYD